MCISLTFTSLPTFAMPTRTPPTFAPLPTSTVRNHLSSCVLQSGPVECVNPSQSYASFTRQYPSNSCLFVPPSFPQARSSVPHQGPYGLPLVPLQVRLIMMQVQDKAQRTSSPRLLRLFLACRTCSTHVSLVACCTGYTFHSLAGLTARMCRSSVVLAATVIQRTHHSD